MVPASAIKYRKLWYKTACTVGFRRIKPEPGQAYGKQIFTIGGKRCGKSEEELKQLGDLVLEKLHTGSTEEEAETWGKAQVAIS